MSGGNISTGDNNINISGTDIHIHGSIQQSSGMRLARDEFDRVLVDARRTSIVKTPLSVNKNLLIGISGFMFSALANISSIFSANPASIPRPLMDALNVMTIPVLMGSVIFLIPGIYLKLHGASLGILFGYNVERGKDNNIYISRVKAKCPLCGGRMRMLAASQSNEDHTLVCNRNRLHRCVFDMTTLADVADEFEERRGEK